MLAIEKGIRLAHENEAASPYLIRPMERREVTRKRSISSCCYQFQQHGYVQFCISQVDPPMVLEKWFNTYSNFRPAFDASA